MAASAQPHRDRRIQRRLVRGEESALGELYDQFAPLVHGLALQLLADPEAADQLAREVFAQAWKHPEEFDPAAGSMRSWIGALTRRCAAHRLPPQHGVAEDVPRLRGAAGRLSVDEPLDPDPVLRGTVLARAVSGREPRFPVPGYAEVYIAETARLDALLRDLGEPDWRESAELRWHGGAELRHPAEVLCHLTAVDGLLAKALGLPDPCADPGTGTGSSPDPDPGTRARIDLDRRTALLRERSRRRSPESVRAQWRAQTRAVVATAALDGADGQAAGDAPVDYGGFRLPVRSAFLDRAFECWIHADDIAEAVGYPYEPPRSSHLRQLIGLAAQLLPTALTALRASGNASLTAWQHPDFGDPRGPRAVRLIIEGRGSSEWLVPLEADTPAPPPDTEPVAVLAIDGVEFCHLAAAHRDADRLPCGITGDRAAARDLLHAARLLSRP